MDYNQEQFFRTQFDVPKMPFYMSYPMQNLYLTEMEYEKDMDRMKELYPKDVGRILEYVEDECDKMEYEGSLMFDEYPDRIMLEMVTDRIYQRVADGGADVEAEQYWGGMQPPKSRLNALRILAACLGHVRASAASAAPAWRSSAQSDRCDFEQRNVSQEMQAQEMQALVVGRQLLRKSKVSEETIADSGKNAYNIAIAPAVAIFLYHGKRVPGCKMLRGLRCGRTDF